MPWTCEQTEDRLLDALEGTLEAASKAEMDAHLVACAACSGLAASVRQTIGRLHGLEPVEPAPWLVTKILEQTTAPKPAGRRRFSWLGQLLQPRFALGVMAVLVTFSIVMHTAASGPSGSLAAMNPVQMYRQTDRRAHLVYAHGVKFFSDLRVVYEIQSRFQPQTESAPASAPEKRSLEKSDRLLYAGFGRTVQGDRNEMRYPS
jgi:anti-sigma factor RsiW